MGKATSYYLVPGKGGERGYAVLIESLAGPWSPEKYADEYQENLLRVIKAKRKGKKPKLETEEPARGGEVVDLMERLRRSLQGSKGERRTAAKSAKTAESKPAKRRTRSKRAA